MIVEPYLFSTAAARKRSLYEDFFHLSLLELFDLNLETAKMLGTNIKKGDTTIETK